MGNIRGMTGTSWHVETLRISDDKRHKSRCLFYNNSLKICRHRKSAYCGIRCGGSSRCIYYCEEEREVVYPRVKDTLFQINSLKKSSKYNYSNERNTPKIKEIKKISKVYIKNITNLKVGDKLVHNYFTPRLS